MLIGKRLLVGDIAVGPLGSRVGRVSSPRDNKCWWTDYMPNVGYSVGLLRKDKDE